MRERIPTLLLEANGTHWVAVAVETVVRGILRVRAELPEAAVRHRVIRKLLGRRYQEASYLDDWKEAFCGAPELDARVCTITNLVELRGALKRLGEYPLVIVLHSAAGDRMSTLLAVAQRFRQRPGRLAVFVGNEYDLMAEKIRFINESGADYICTQLPMDAAEWLYSECPNARVLPMPHALNPNVYRPVDGMPRTTDIGFVGDLYDRLIGDRERSAIVETFQAQGPSWGLSVDIRSSRMRRHEWADFLRGCRGVIGAESGTYYLEKDGHTLACAKTFLRSHPDASFEQVFERCFAGASDCVSGKAISSRHFEPIGTRTCQVLVEGRYNEILLPEIHYICVKRDLSDAAEAVRRFRDQAYRETIVRAAYEYVNDVHTYRHRVRSFLEAMNGSRRPKEPSFAGAARQVPQC